MAKAVREILHKTALQAPSSSGVYLWRNRQGDVIYVGKAKNLKNRLTSYFSGSKDIKTKLLVAHAESIEYITTANEYEAFLLENNLIKKYNPRYNIDLKDGKSYPVLRITNEDFPRVIKTRRVLEDGSTYFGPYPDAGALDTFIDTLYRIYPVRRCKTLKKRDAPCLYYHIGRCDAPCCKKISREAYTEYIGEIASLLEGKGDDTLKKIKAEMQKASENLDFEKAARLRDGLSALSIMQKQNIVQTFDGDDRDYIAYWREGELVSFTVLKLRGGKLEGRGNYRTVSLNEDAELIGEFFNAYYTDKAEVPPHIYIPNLLINNLSDIEDSHTDTGKSPPPRSHTVARSPSSGGTPQLPDRSVAFLSPNELARWFSETLGAETEIVPVSDASENAKYHTAAINMAKQNAHEDIVRRLRERGDIPALEELKTLLSLDTLPVRIEGFDIAHIGGKFPVASLISFYNGNPDKKNYRYFRLKTTDGIIDDFASMREAASRRYTRLLNEGRELPDLLLIDGGIGQVNAVQSVLTSLGIDIPIAGLAEKNEEIYRPGNSTPVVLPRRSDALRLLQRVRDETHRFATSKNQRLRTKENTVSIFLELPGVGEKRARTLIKTFTTLENLANADKERIADALGVSADEAEKIMREAKKLNDARKEKKAKQIESLENAGTTVQKAAAAHYIDSLARAALDGSGTE
ncbi:excinuclease ABC subunit UvrC [Treponema socranskii]|uniref:excinuclease ABC subunit UvrC n=2 Tax=Treponema socranskii TaxID=53419 RepID=UPI0028E39F82|nr:excinuclease ABC subunit UvrC [Treponema socranskii]